MRIASLCFVAILLVGCASGNVMSSWTGHSATDLVFAWGAPDRQQRLEDGRQVIAYDYTHSVAGTSYECEATFQVNAKGIVVGSRATGNLGGCNGLLFSKPSAQ